MDVQIEGTNLTFRAGKTYEGQRVYEAAIAYLINQIPMEKRPKEGSIIDVQPWVGGKPRLPAKD